MLVRLLSLLFFFIALFVSFSAEAQNNLELDSLKSPRIPYKHTLDPAVLVQKLTEGKETQLEKFNVIFSWVANNIHYNHRQANSGSPTRYKSIKRILRQRTGVCTDFARLMDTLCNYAGIQNTSINGYAKEFIFDVNDSLYFENHTWNAVKLENKWFLYDVTWTAGSTKYELTRFGKWRQKVIEKFKKHKKEKLDIFSIKKKKDPLCGIPGNIFRDTTRYEVQKPFYRFLTGLLNLFPYRIKPVYNYIKGTNYYLTNPEVFALEHFPLDSIWSLSPKYNCLDSFRLDSTYYHHVENQFHDLFEGQIREGQHCFDCDDFLGLSAFEKEKYNIKIAKNHLPNNPFFKASSEMNVARFFLKDFLKEKDSLQKFALFDSTLTYIDSSARNFRRTSGPAAREYRFHVDKNKAKTAQLKLENKNHAKQMDHLFLDVNRRKKKIASLEFKSDSYEQRSIRAIRKFSNAFVSRSLAKVKDEKLKAIQSDFYRAVKRSDSLTSLISLKRYDLLGGSRELYLGLSVHLNLLKPYTWKFNSDGNDRKYGLHDSYDLKIGQRRKEIDSLEQQFVTNVEHDVLMKADTMYSTFMKLYRMIYDRDQTNLKVAKLGTTLRIQGMLSKDSLELLRVRQLGRIKDDICWNRDQKVLFQVLQGNFISFYNYHKSLKRVISKNTSEELKRNKFTQKYIDIKRKRILSAKEGNSKILRYMKKLAYTEIAIFKKVLKNRK
ncbi:MAG: transglutaminase domain-containing protein [Bacteroidota bacterium]